jgi:hypothetical protein
MTADLSLPAITLWQPWASLVACGAKRWETRGQRTRYRGRIAIHASSVPQPHEPATAALPAIHDALWPHLGYTTRPMPSGVRAFLPRGVIVATAELTDCCPIGDPYSFRTGLVEGDEGDFPGQGVIVLHPPLYGEDLWTLVHDADGRQHDITDQIPFGDWEPGRWAWRLDDIKPTTERCPWCWGGGCQAWEQLTAEQQAGWGTEPMGHLVPCPVCDSKMSCDPVPARGMPGIWKWRP